MKLRSSKDKEVIATEEIEKLGRANHKAFRTSEMVRTVLIERDAAGIIHDLEDNQYNAQAQRLDADGNPIVKIVDNTGHVDRQGNVGVGRHDGNRNGPDNLDARIENVRRTLADFNRPNEFYSNRSAICPPAFQWNDFELKPQYYTLVGQHTFHAHPAEHPVDHIEKFEDLASSIKANGVSEDYLFCKLFPYSLAGEAAQWLKQLEPGSLTTWRDIKTAFLNNFYEDAKTEELRDLIIQFTQGPAETLKAAWLRFKGYQRDCPHHNIDEV